MKKGTMNKKKFWTLAAAGAALGAQRTALAVDVQQGVDPLVAMGNLTTYILGIVTAVGVIALIWGGVQLALALKSQDASQRTNAILFLAGGAIMVGIRFVLQAIGVTV